MNTSGFRKRTEKSVRFSELLEIEEQLTDKKLQAIERNIASMERAKETRLTELADPKRQKARALWEELFRIVKELDDMGEDLSDSEGNALYITGTMFFMDHDGVVEK